MSKRIEEMKASEAMEFICNGIDFLAWLLDGDDAEEDEREDMMECAEARVMVGLPRDADDKPIHIGDLVAVGDDAFCVDELHLVGGGDRGCFWKVLNGAGEPFTPMALRHVPDDTIEGILLEAVMRAHCDTLADKGGTDVTDLLERLRDLMGGDDD